MKISTPSKFTPGISALWRGCSLKLLLSGIIYSIKNYNYLNYNKDNNEFLFSSGRSAINAVLNAFEIGENDEVILSSFTCDAVTHAILATCAKPIYVDISSDLTMNEDSIISCINNNTKAIIIQNTFGRLGISQSLIDSLSKTEKMRNRG